MAKNWNRNGGGCGVGTPLKQGWTIYGYAYEVCLETHALKVESTDYPLIVSPFSAETLMERAVEAVKIVPSF